ncbi:TetR/AcrR family transcriptional regulator, partial [Streptomyces sp. NPDC059755]|uniref:TetR/AcrR family transcriptional regulator n=1 Tax=Streptomyces sp. NPDC059755 TaxID=3346934 RepID=UPI0036499DF8
MVERILDAGRQVLAEYGYEGASTSRIATTAGISPGSLYQYFPHKDAIVSAVLERYSDTLVSSVTTRMCGGVGPTAPRFVRAKRGARVVGHDLET